MKTTLMIQVFLTVPGATLRKDTFSMECRTEASGRKTMANIRDAIETWFREGEPRA
mgnify:CR=1 FL=1